MPVTFEFKIFDEANENLLSYSDYNSDEQRIRGFKPNQEIRSAIFNNVLKQSSMITYQIAKYISDNNEVDFTFDMGAQVLSEAIGDFFDNFHAKTADTANSLNVTGESVGNVPIVVQNASRELEFINPKPFQSNWIEPDTLKYFIIDTNIDNVYEKNILLEVRCGENIDSFYFTNNSLSALALIEQPSPQGSEIGEITSGGRKTIRFLNSNASAQIALDIGFTNIVTTSTPPTVGKYFIGYSRAQELENVSFRLTVKEF